MPRLEVSFLHAKHERSGPNANGLQCFMQGHNGRGSSFSSLHRHSAVSCRTAVGTLREHAPEDDAECKV